MRFSTISTAAALSLLSGANAIITGITAPSTIAAGEPFFVTLNTADYIQTVYDVAVAFGIADGQGYPQSLGTVFNSEYLGPSKSNILDPITFVVEIDAATPFGTHVLSAAVFSLYGAVAGPVADMYNVTVTVGLENSIDTVTSTSS
jgi:Nis1 family